MNTFLYVSAIILAFLSREIPAFSQPEKPLRIAVASNFTPVLKKILPDFYQQTQIKTQIISGATGSLFLQIKHGAPFDIFLSADNIRPLQLEKEKRIVPNSRHTYALGQLALYSAQKTSHLDDLKKTPKRFAIANPKIAPYGKAAKETLEHLDVWAQYQSALIQGINVNQTFTQIRSQSVQSGLVSNSLLVLNNLSGAVIPLHYHQPIAQQLVIVKSSENIDKATQLSNFLLSKKVQQKIMNLGYANITTTSVNKGADLL